MSVKNILTTTIITVFIASLMFMVGFAEETTLEPQEVYQVYLDGEKIGLIYNKEKLYELIDDAGQDIKEKYEIDAVYPPNGLEITKYITYDEKISSENEVYETIKNKKPFTISAYKIVVKPTEGDAKNIYVLNEKDFEEAINDFIYAFIPKESYEAFINNTQKKIETTGSLIEAIYFDETVTIKKAYVNAEEEIFTNASALSQYLMFGTTEKQKTYVVKAGEDIESIAYNHELNTQEFMIANPDFTSEKQLLSAGQIVNIGLISPMLNLVYEEHEVIDEEKFFETEIEYNANLSAGVRYTRQEGENGINRNTQKVKIINGVIQEAIVMSSEEIKPAIPKIIVRGRQSVDNVFDNTVWKWPTNSPYTITSPYGYRGGELHRGLDISGKHGSPIYAASGGIVTFAGNQNKGGKVVEIDHQNGYSTQYAHMSEIYVTVGQTVTRGYTIGAMGRTGFATGTHLHYSIWVGSPWVGGAYTINPLSKYR